MILPVALLLTLGQASGAAPPPPPMGDCFVPGPWIVFFPRDAAVLDRESRAILDAFVAKQADACGDFRFSITGHADGGESAGVDRRRAAAVRAYLQRRGLRRLIGFTRSRGSAEPRIARPRGVEELQNRRVVLEALPGG